ncbi:MAG: acyltransferase family protein [Chloroflexota bacterium]
MPSRPPAPAQPNRIVYMDTLRAFLMILGVFYHASLIYRLRTDNLWRVNSPETHIAFNYLSEFVHSFRMPAFFIIAGFFAAMLISKYGVSVFARNRYVRLGIPLLFFGLAVNPFMALSSANVDMSPLSPVYWMSGAWLAHLWFLQNLIIYTVVIFCIYKLYPRIEQHIEWMDLNYGWLMVIFATWGLLSFTSHLAGWGFIYGDKGVIRYFPYFAFGLVCFKNKLIPRHFIRRRVNYLIAFAFLLGSVTLREYAFWQAIEGPLLSMHGLACAGILIQVFQSLSGLYNQVIRDISDASYTIYLLHQPLIVWFGHLIIDIEINIFAEYLILTIFTCLFCFFFHHGLVNKVPLLAFLFNGKPIPAKKSHMPQPAHSTARM